MTRIDQDLRLLNGIQCGTIVLAGMSSMLTVATTVEAVASGSLLAIGSSILPGLIVITLGHEIMVVTKNIKQILHEQKSDAPSALNPNTLTTKCLDGTWIFKGQFFQKTIEEGLRARKRSKTNIV